MTEHVCEWVWDIRENDAWFFCKDPYCKRPMGALEIEARLNATERLSAEIVNGLLEGDDSPDLLIYERVALRAYANILEGKDD